MQYYRIPQKFDGVQLYDPIERRHTITLVARELYTLRELQRYHINPAKLEPVNVSRRRVCYIFGARFAAED
jgi:hypothetical protein